jgi:hypothetical protein
LWRNEYGFKQRVFRFYFRAIIRTGRYYLQGNDGAKEMLLVDEVDDKESLTGLFEAMYAELPKPKPKKKK